MMTSNQCAIQIYKEKTNNWMKQIIDRIFGKWTRLSVTCPFNKHTNENKNSHTHTNAIYTATIVH